MSIDTPKVSIVTLLGQRSTFIPLLKYCVQYQTYPESSIEWIILDDGPLDRSDQFNDDLATYVRVYKKLNIGRKRQIACDLSIGEFIIFFDDDDIHFPYRIERSVKKLQKVGSRFITGNSKMLLCDIESKKVYQTGPFHKNHCTAATMCFRKEIFKGTGFRESDQAGEEAYFLKNWTIPVVQLNDEDTIIALAHKENTVKKNHLFSEDKVFKTLEEFQIEPNLLKLLMKLKIK